MPQDEVRRFAAGGIPNQGAGFFSQRENLPPVGAETRAKDLAARLDRARAGVAGARVPNLGDAAGAGGENALAIAAERGLPDRARLFQRRPDGFAGAGI